MLIRKAKIRQIKCPNISTLNIYLCRIRQNLFRLLRAFMKSVTLNKAK